MRLDVPDLSPELEREIEERQPWMHPYHFGGPVYAGYFKHHGLDVTCTTSGSPAETVELMRTAFDCYMAGQPFHDLDAGLARVAAEARRPLSEMRVLDIASATGRFTFRAAQQAAAEVVGVEIRGEQVEQAQLVQRAAANLRALPVRFVHDPTSADTPGYLADERYGIVLSLGLLYHLRDPLQHLENLARLAEHGIVLHTAANLYGQSGQWALGRSDRYAVTKSIEGLAVVPYYRDLPDLVHSVGFAKVGLIENPLVRGLRPPMFPSGARRAAYLATPPAAVAVATRVRARWQAERRARVLRHRQSPSYFTLWAAR